MMCDYYNWQGERIGTIELSPKIFEVPLRPLLVQQAIVIQQANKRRPIAHTKTRGEVSGGGRKPWKQKGTGRARQGSIRSPQWKGGGVVFGPSHDREFSKKINQKAKQKALRMALSDKASSKHIIVIDKISLENRKTKEFERQLKKFPFSQSKSLILFILPPKHELVQIASRNIPWIHTIRADSLNVRDVVHADWCVLPKAGLDIIHSRQ